MTDPAFIIAFVLVFLFSIYLGFTVGTYAGERAATSREYWVYNLIAFVACIVATAVLTLIPLLCSAPLGFLAGCFTGLKMGFGESSGPWKKFDRFFNVNKGHRARHKGKAAPDMISVAQESDAGQGASQGSGHAARKGTRKKR